MTPSYSMNKKNLKQIKIYPDPKKNFMPSQRNKPFNNNIQEICNSIYEDFFPCILQISKTHFFERFNKEVDEIFITGKYKNSENIKFLSEAKENIIKKYDNDFKYLNEEYSNFLKNRQKYKYLTHFRKHCIDTDYYAIHFCSSNKQGKFIEIRNKSLNNKDIPFVICEECKQCYLSKFILMFCNNCNRKYFSNILRENENENILPATWKKYHCNTLINAMMKCIKCKSILYYNLVTKNLVCLNKKCNFNSKPESILWTCNVCNQDFRSGAKIYNPLEFQILNKSINYALLKQVRAAPKELPCHCKKKLSKLNFFHKEECKGELYKGMLIDKPILVCSKCKAINFEEKFTWICPACTVKFHLHRVIGCRPFSKKKYIINKSYNQGERNGSRRKLDKDNLAKNLLGKSVTLYNSRDFNFSKEMNNSQKSSHSKLFTSEDINNISTFNTKNKENFSKEKFYKKIEKLKINKSQNNDRNKDRNKDRNNERNNNRNNGKELNKIYDYNKKCWIINLKKGNQLKKVSPNNNNQKHYKTLLDILQERMNTDMEKDKNVEKNNFNKTMLPSQRIKNHNIIKRKKDFGLNMPTENTLTKEYVSTRNHNKINVHNISNSFNHIIKRKETEEKKEGNKNKEKKKDINLNSKNDRNFIKIKFQKKLSPFRPEMNLRHHKIEEKKNDKNSEDNKQKKPFNAKYQRNFNNYSLSKTLSSNEPFKKTIDTKIFSSLQTNNNNNFNSSIRSFRYWKKREPASSSNESKKYEKMKYPKINDFLTSNKLETEPSYSEKNNKLRKSSKNNFIFSNSSSFRLSLLTNNGVALKMNNIKNHNNEKKEDNEALKKEKENKLLILENTIKTKYNEKEVGEENNFSDENKDEINDLSKLLKKRQSSKEKEEKENNVEKDDKFNESFLYEKNDATSSEEEDDENKDTIKDIFISRNPKKNFRESLILKGGFIRQSILISQEKLNNLTNKTDIPTIDESEYSYLKPIGEGTYGIVYLVENNKTSEQYAMKKIICRDYNELIKQKNELQLIFSVKHENILRLQGIQFKYLDETTSAIYVLMELAQNDWSKEIKRRIIAKKYYKESELIHLLKQIIKGFLFLQDKNIAHRDIKPQNILLFPNNVYKIADFGEAKFIKNIAEQSTLRGSELFMSPLLYKGYKFNQKNVLHNPFKSDVFSLGYCLLYAMCLNLKVLEEMRDLTSMKSIVSNINKFIAKNKYSDKLINIIYRMIDPIEDTRFDFEDLSIELEKL